MKLVLLAILSLFALPASAEICNPSTATSACLGKECKESEIGTTLLDYGRENVIACLVKSGGGQIWKGAYGDGGSTTGYPKNKGPITASAGGGAASCYARTDGDGVPSIFGAPVPIAEAYRAYTKTESYPFTNNYSSFGFCSVSPLGVTLTLFNGSHSAEGTIYTPQAFFTAW